MAEKAFKVGEYVVVDDKLTRWEGQIINVTNDGKYALVKWRWWYPAAWYPSLSLSAFLPTAVTTP